MEDIKLLEMLDLINASALRKPKPFTVPITVLRDLLEIIQSNPRLKELLQEVVQ